MWNPLTSLASQFTPTVTPSSSSSSSAPRPSWIPDSHSERNSEAIQDLMKLEEFLAELKMPNSHKPFMKKLVTVLGATSSGKSAVINHFFKLGLKRSVNQEQDTHYTLIESVPEEEFRRIVGETYQRRDFTEQELMRDDHDVHLDPRRDVVYHCFNTEDTLSRYEQFESFHSIFCNNKLMASIVVNETYLANDEHLESLRNTVFIDSPGFTATTKSPEDLQTNMFILQFLIKISDLTLFLLSCGSMSNVGQEINLLEMSVVWSCEGKARFLESAKVIFPKQEFKEQPGFFDNLNPVKLVSSVYQQVMALAEKFKEEKAIQYYGSSVWDKIHIVLTKLDTARTLNDSGVKGQFFDLGVMLGSKFKVVKTPTADQCYAIALPEKQVQYQSLILRNQVVRSSTVFALFADEESTGPFVNTFENSGELARLEAKVFSNDRHQFVAKRLEIAILIISREILAKLSTQSYLSTLWNRNLSPTVEDIKSRSEARYRSLVGSSSSSSSSSRS